MQQATTSVHFDRMPSPTLGFLRAALATGSGVGEGRSIPPLTATLAGLRPDPEQVRRYAELCGYAPARSLPFSYPHVLAAPLHLAVLTHKAFPLRLLGVVHVRNAVTQERAIEREEPLDVVVRVEGHREVSNGIEFDLQTRISDSTGNCVWHSTSTNLVRGPRREGGGAPWAAPDLTQHRELGQWQLPADLGRRYGWLAGDINPIHLYPLSARLFGFKRHIAHGMWTFARCAAALLGEQAPARTHMEVAFRRPVFLPSAVRLHALTDGDRTDYALTDRKGEIFHVTGSLQR